MADIYTLSGKISSLEKLFITEAHLKKIISAKTFEEFINCLEGTFFSFPSISSPDEIFEFFEKEREKLVEEITRNLDEKIRTFFLLKYDYHNLRVLIEGKQEFSYYSILNFYILKKKVEGKIDYSQIPEFLHNAIGIVKSEKKLEEKLLNLKRNYYENLYKIAKGICEFLKNYVKIEIDFANLHIFLNKKLGEIPLKVSDLIDNGNIEREKFLNDEKLRNSLTQIYKGISVPVNEENFEIERYKTLIFYLKNARIIPDGIEKVLSFYIAREIEIENLQRIAIFKFYSQPEDILKKIVIPPYQYKGE